MAQFDAVGMINAKQDVRRDSRILFVTPPSENAVTRAAALLARWLGASKLALPEGAPRQQWRALRQVVRRGGHGIIVSLGPEAHMANALAGGRGVRRVFFQAMPALPGAGGAEVLFWRLLPRLARRGVLAAPTPIMRRDLAAWAGVGEREVLHLPLPVALPTPLPAVGDLRGRAPLVLFPGPLVRAHQPGLAVKALRHLPQEVRLVLSGEGEAARALQHMVDRLGLRRRVRWLAPGEDWREWLARARVACLPARFAPWAPGAVLALAHGLPLVGTETPGLHALLADCSACGAMVAMTDVEALAAALARWLEAPGDAAPRQALARQFAPEVVAWRWRQVFNP